MTTKREPKTIEEARELLLAHLPAGWSLWVHAQWSDDLSHGGQYSSVSYTARIRPELGRDAPIDVEAHTPARLAKETLRRLLIYVETYHPRLAAPRPVPKPAARKKTTPRLAGSTQLAIGFKRA